MTKSPIKIGNGKRKHKVGKKVTFFDAVEPPSDKSEDEEVFHDAQEPPDPPSLTQTEHKWRSKRKRKNVTRLAFLCSAALATTSLVINSGGYTDPIDHKVNTLANKPESDYILEEELSPCPSLQSKAHEYMKQHLQLVDLQDDINSNDWSFIP